MQQVSLTVCYFTSGYLRKVEKTSQKCKGMKYQYAKLYSDFF